MKRVLVTGATGFIGRHTLSDLIVGGYEVHAVSSTRKIASLNVTWHRLDLHDRDATDLLMRKIAPTHLLHLAWDVTPGQFWHSPENKRWQSTSLSLLKIFAESGGRRAVIAGTCAEYDWSAGVCSELLTPLYPQSEYGHCKNNLQQALSVATVGNQSLDKMLSIAWGRIFFLFGPNEHSSRLVPSVINALIAGQPVIIQDGDQIRDFMYVKDVASAFAFLLDSNVEGAINISSGQPMLVRDVALAIADVFDRKDAIQFNENLLSKQRSFIVGDNRRLTNEVGWIGQYSFFDAIMETVEWWKTHQEIQGSVS